MKAPRKAIILSAGFGTRMVPLTNKTPKPMMSIWGRPAIDHILTMLEKWGVKEVLVNIHHAPQPLLQYLTRNHKRALSINISFEHEIMGTGGAIRRAEWFIDKAPFWIINGDIAVDVNPKPLLDAYQRMHPSAVLWIKNDTGPRTIIVKRNIVQTFKAPSPGINDTYTFCGLHLVSPTIISAIPKKAFSSIIDTYTDLMKQGHHIAGISVPHCFWADIGTVEGYLDAHREIFRRAIKKQPGGELISSAQLKRMRKIRKDNNIKGFVSIGENVDIKVGATIYDAVIGNNVKIARDADIRNAIVADNTSVHGKVRRMALPLSEMADPNLFSAIDKIGLCADSATAEPLEPRGSNRTFTRIRSCSKSVIAVRYSLERPENGLYVSNARFLRNLGVRVPDVLLEREKDNLLIMEDVGIVSLHDIIMDKSTKSIIRTYKKVIDSILPMHRNGVVAAKKKRITLAPPFSRDMYQWENNLFILHLLKNTLSAPVSRIRKTKKALERVAPYLLAEPECLLHRDLQSTNVLFHREKPVFIDFQGMRLGCAAYDMASLLCDPYVFLHNSIQDQLIEYWKSISGESIHNKNNIFWYAAIQRLVQAIGAYARLSANPGTASFGRYIIPGLKMLDRALHQVHDTVGLRSTVDWCLEELSGHRIRMEGDEK